MTDPLTPAQRYVRNHRDELIEILKNGDQTLRVLAIAVLLEGGIEADVEKVRRELELLAQTDDWRRFDHG